MDNRQTLASISGGRCSFCGGRTLLLDQMPGFHLAEAEIEFANGFHGRNYIIVIVLSLFVCVMYMTSK